MPTHPDDQPCLRALAKPAPSGPARLLLTLLLVLTLLPASVRAQGAASQPLPDVQAHHQHHVTPVDPPPQVGEPAHGGHVGAPAQRELVRLPVPMREHMLANMRDHLGAIAEIQAALADGAYDQAAKVAEQRLGMSSMASHGAEHMAPLMPARMQQQGTAMHHAASQFAVEAQNSSASGDPKPAWAALARTTAACVGCHAAYRVQ
jgi:predicted CxxxxCH...CXXCH cytochrome family protein